MAKRRPSPEVLAAMLTEGNFAPAGEATPREDEGPIALELDIEAITPYERNPRRERNPLYAEIKASIRAQGLRQPLVVTRRPGEDGPYVVKAGGNTRLAVLRELAAETGEPRFRRLHCLFEPWTTESAVLTAHLIENDLRGNLTFIDRALAVRDLGTLLADELGPALTQYTFIEALTDRGYRIERSLLSRMEYACEVLLPRIPEALRAGLGRRHIQRIRQLDLAARRLWQERDLGDEFDEVFGTLLARHDGPEWQQDRLRRALEREIAERSGEDLRRIGLELDEVLGGEPPTPRIEPPVSLDAVLVPKPTPRARPEAAPGGTGDDETEADGEATSLSAPGADVAARPSDIVPHEATGPAESAELRRRACALAEQIAAAAKMGDIVAPLPECGAGFLVDFVYGEADESPEDKLARATLWWFLATVSEQFHAPPARVSAELPVRWRDKPIAVALTRPQARLEIFSEYTVIEIGPLLGPRVVSVLDEPTWALLVELLAVYRTLGRSARSTGGELWDE